MVLVYTKKSLIFLSNSNLCLFTTLKKKAENAEFVWSSLPTFFTDLLRQASCCPRESCPLNAENRFSRFMFFKPKESIAEHSDFLIINYFNLQAFESLQLRITQKENEKSLFCVFSVATQSASHNLIVTSFIALCYRITLSPWHTFDAARAFLYILYVFALLFLTIDFNTVHPFKIQVSIMQRFIVLLYAKFCSTSKCHTSIHTLLHFPFDLFLLTGMPTHSPTLNNITSHFIDNPLTRILGLCQLT